MIARVCDFCGVPMPMDRRFDDIFEIDGKKYRMSIIKVVQANGVRWSEADYCKECLHRACRITTNEQANGIKEWTRELMAYLDRKQMAKGDGK